MPITVEERRARQRKYLAEKYADPEWRTWYREYQRAWRQANHGQVQGYRKKWADAHPEELRQSRQAWASRNPERVQKIRKAMHSLFTALRKGTLTRPVACEGCATECLPDAAHHDYDKPLEVRWLCKTCHRNWDKSHPKSV